MKLFTLIFICLFFFVTAHAHWQKFDAGTNASFRGLDVVNPNVVWASGTAGTVIRSTNGGKSWEVIRVKGAEKLDFRDIEAFDQNTAYVLSIGNGESSRIYKTTDGGKNWRLQFKNTEEKAFFDSIAFWDERNGMAQSDPVDGKYVFYRTTDGENWTRVSPAGLPAAKEGEAAFAASGTCIITKGKKHIWLITGGIEARVYYSKDRGETWKAAATPMVKGTAGSGIFSIAMRNKKHGVIVGGNYEKPEENKNNLALTGNGGKTWQAGTGLNCYRSGVTYIDKKTILAVGSGGSDISMDGGRNWESIDKGNYNAVQSLGKDATWAVGPRGMVAKFNWIVRVRKDGSTR
jgi:photosystem II stability/assembly factor-like uncharacterized protein